MKVKKIKLVDDKLEMKLTVPLHFFVLVLMYLALAFALGRATQAVNEKEAIIRELRDKRKHLNDRPFMLAPQSGDSEIGDCR